MFRVRKNICGLHSNYTGYSKSIVMQADYTREVYIMMISVLALVNPPTLGF